MADRSFPREPEEITAEWVSAAVGRDVQVKGVEQIGIGVGMLGRLYRVSLDDGSSVVAKLPTTDAGARANVVAPLRFYEKEVSFYTQAADLTPVSTAHVHAAAFDAESGDFVLLLEDLASRRMEDQIAGCPLADAETAVDALVDLHAHWWNSKSFPAWLPSYADPPFPQVIAGMYAQAWPRAQEVFGDHLSQTFREYGDRYVDLVPWFVSELTTEPVTLCHGDFRLDNMFFGTHDSHAKLTIVDWQISFRGPGGYDLGYFVSQSLPTDVRRANEQALIDRYRTGLAAKGCDYPVDKLRDDYVRTVAYCFIYAVVSAGQIEPTNERMVQLILSILDRAVVAIEDNKALEILP